MKTEKIKKIGVLTSGGDSPGMNAAIRSIARTALNEGLKVAFIYDGYKGILENKIKTEIKHKDVGDIITRGGTILGSSRYLPFHKKEVRLKAIKILKEEHKIDALIAIGGDGTFTGAQCLDREGLKTIGIPGTIDNDIQNTDFTIGFDTCLNTIVTAVDKIRDTASSHHRCVLVEVMGRDCGDLAIYSGIASGADFILVPEHPWTKKQIFNVVSKRKKQGKNHTIIMMTENQTNPYEFAKEINDITGVISRASVLGFIQRGGSPSFFDRYLASRMGYESVKCLLKNETGYYLGFKNNKIVKNDIKNKIKSNRNLLLYLDDLNKDLT